MNNNTPDTEWDKITFENEFAGWWDNKTALTERIEDHITSLLSSRDTYWKEQIEKAREEERERIEAIFKEHVPPHAMDLEDSVWLKRLLNKAFNHDKNI